MNEPGLGVCIAWSGKSHGKALCFLAWKPVWVDMVPGGAGLMCPCHCVRCSSQLRGISFQMPSRCSAPGFNMKQRGFGVSPLLAAVGVTQRRRWHVLY